MELFFAPLSCAMATRIALYETGQKADFTQVTQSHAHRINQIVMLPFWKGGCLSDDFISPERIRSPYNAFCKEVLDGIQSSRFILALRINKLDHEILVAI